MRKTLQWPQSAAENLLELPKKTSVVTSVRATLTAALPGVKSKFKPIPHHIHPVKEGGPQLYTKSTHFKISSTKEKKICVNNHSNCQESDRER